MIAVHHVFFLYAKPVPFQVNKLDEHLENMLRKPIQDKSTPSSSSDGNVFVEDQLTSPDNVSSDCEVLVNSQLQAAQTKRPENVGSHGGLSNRTLSLPGQTQKRRCDPNWYNSAKTWMETRLNTVMGKIKFCNRESLEELNALRAELKKIKTENADLKVQLQILNDENTGHECMAKCKDCSKPIEGLNFCSNDCIERNIQKRLNRN